MSKIITPYSTGNGSKREQVEEMFDNISSSYDMLNRILSFGIDIYWRRKTVKTVKKHLSQKSSTANIKILDVATGTGDLAIEVTKRIKNSTVTGVDISQGMLDIGIKKIAKKGLKDRITLQQADSVDLPFKDGEFQAFTIGFGVRNFEDLKGGLIEMKRVLEPGGIAAILEFSKPQAFPLKQLYSLYSETLLPLWGKIVSKDNSAYSYLPESVRNFPDGSNFTTILSEVGYREVKQQRLSGGIVTVYYAYK